MVLNSGAVPLRQYVTKMASGATPSVAEYDLYYASKEDGIPFIRVQNLSDTGVLKLTETKFINENTHLTSLKRSQVSENDVLVKITGVGRMAVASVPPIGFVGNINQHSVVIKTESREISKQLAAFLNSDIGEKLASRRATGGTRPALDYPALRSIPVICDERILSIANTARKAKAQKEAEANQLLASIDDYLLGELGINLPEEEENTIENRSFKLKSKKVIGGRLDPFYHEEYYYDLFEQDFNYPIKKLQHFLIKINYGANTPNNYVESGVPFLRIKDLKPNEINISKMVFIPEELRDTLKSSILEENDFLISRSGSIGIVAKADKSVKGFAFGSFMIRFRISEKSLNHEFLSYYLNSSFIVKYLERNKIGSIQGNITIPTIKSIPIIVPSFDEQLKISNEISKIRNEAKAKLKSAKQDFAAAKQEIENLILNQN
jgi:restriction endonuclease S subunit